MEYCGEYILNIINGKIMFPWETDSDKELLWLIYRCRDKSFEGTSIIIFNKNELDEFISASKEYYASVEVLHKGDFVRESNGTWKVPECITEHLKDSEIVFQGMGEYIEILTKDELSAYESLYPGDDYE